MKNIYSYLLKVTLVLTYFRICNMQEIVVRALGGAEFIKTLAKESGHYYKGPVMGFPNTYLLVPNENILPHYHKRSGQYTKHLLRDPRVMWAEMQKSVSRQKRDMVDPVDKPLERVKRLRDSFVYQEPFDENSGYFNDELWPQQWYLLDTRRRTDLPKLDLNVLPVYKAGITGRGVRISILDDGIEYTHQDLINNFDPEISYDCNEDDDDPLPNYDVAKSNNHGTRCAGEIAMTADNGKCGVGIAFNAKIGGIKLLDGLVTDRIEGTALGYKPEKVDIYSASWGPNDDGETVEGPGRLASEAILKGIHLGRNGKGSIYVWASGNGGNRNDNCNCDGYLTSIYTLTIGSASQKGEFPWYGETCASTLAVTYSSGAYKDQMVSTTDLNNNCTTRHTGTSASAPLAAGIIALALEVNPDLTWRDVQHLVVWTSELSPVADNPGWQQNGAGLWFNTRFGFGLMNADSLVKSASTFISVPRKYTCKIKSNIYNNSSTFFGYYKPIKIKIASERCRFMISYLEHVEIKTNIVYPVRGSLELYLTSPSGTKVQILAPRKLDKSREGFKNWNFMSVMTWGENPIGIWVLTILDRVGPPSNLGYVGDTTLILHGTAQRPPHMLNGPRSYNHEYNRVQNRVKQANLYDVNEILQNVDVTERLINIF